MKFKVLTIAALLSGIVSLAGAQITGKNVVSSQDIDTSIMVIPTVPINNQDSVLVKLYDTIRAISSDDKQQAVAIYHLLQGRELNNLTKYSLVKGNIISSSEIYHLLNKAIIALQSGFTSDSLDLFVARLDDPESQVSGFSFNKRIIDLVKAIVLKGKARNKKDKRVLASIAFMVNDSLYRGNAQLIPPVEIISSVMTFLRSAAIDNKRIDAERVDKLQQELNKYVIYYSSLNNGRQQFKYGLNVIGDELTTLRSNIYRQLQFIADAFNIPLSKWDTPAALTEAVNKFFVGFTKDDLQQFFHTLEKKYTYPETDKVNYERLLRENGHVKEVNNQLDELVRQIKKFENINNEYFSLLDSYYASIVNSLNIAADSSLENKKYVAARQKELMQLKSNQVHDIEASVNLKKLTSNNYYIKFRYKVF